MAILRTEGFDNVGTAQDIATYNKWINYTNSTAGGSSASSSIRNDTPRFGTGQYLRQSINDQINASQSYADLDLSFDRTTIFVACAFRDPSSNCPGSNFIQFNDENQNSQVSCQYSGITHFVTLLRGGTTLATTSTAQNVAQWDQMCIGVFISATAGWMEYYLNGNLVASYYGSGTSRATANGNTKGQTTAGIHAVRFACTTVNNGTFGSSDWDDIVINDNTGPNNTDILGNVRVMGSRANAVGTYSQFAVTGSANNYSATNELSPDGDTSYVSSLTIGAQDTYKFPALPSSATNVLAVVGESITKVDAAGYRQLVTHVRSGGVDADSPTGTGILLPSYRWYGMVMETNPTNSATWAPSDVNNAEFGPKVSA
jgi:hypothetical protein